MLRLEPVLLDAIDPNRLKRPITHMQCDVRCLHASRGERLHDARASDVGDSLDFLGVESPAFGQVHL